MNLNAGDRLEVPRHTLGGATPSLSEPTGQIVTLEPSDGSKPDAAFVSVPLERPGLYRLQVGTVSYPIAVAYPPTESDLGTIEPAGISRALGDVKMRHELGRLPEEAGAADDQSDLSWPLLVLAFSVLVVESFCARWFSR